MSCESIIVAAITGLTLIATALVYQFFSDRNKEVETLTAQLGINR